MKKLKGSHLEEVRQALTLLLICYSEWITLRCWEDMRGMMMYESPNVFVSLIKKMRMMPWVETNGFREQRTNNKTRLWKQTLWKNLFFFWGLSGSPWGRLEAHPMALSWHNFPHTLLLCLSKDHRLHHSSKTSESFFLCWLRQKLIGYKTAELFHVDTIRHHIMWLKIQFSHPKKKERRIGKFKRANNFKFYSLNHSPATRDDDVKKQ